MPVETSYVEKKAGSKVLQDPYSLSCLNWILVVLCLLQPGLEAFTVVRLLCYSLHVPVFHGLQGEEEEEEEQPSRSSAKEHSNVSASRQSGADMQREQFSRAEPRAHFS